MSGKVDAAVSPPTRKERHDEAGGFGLGQLPREPKSCECKSVLLMVGTPPAQGSLVYLPALVFEKDPPGAAHAVQALATER